MELCKQPVTLTNLQDLQRGFLYWVGRIANPTYWLSNTSGILYAS